MNPSVIVSNNDVFGRVCRCADGFRFWPSRRRYLRPGGSSPSSFLRPRHYFLLGTVIYSRLYDYQRTAVSWMFELFKNRLGGILGDEMGLGKTVQASQLWKS